MSQHLYTSTACTHNTHSACRVVCKFCASVCLCPCHWRSEATAHTQQVVAVEMQRRVEHLEAGLDGQPDPELHTITIATVSTGMWGWSCSCRAKGSSFPSDRMASSAAAHHQENGA